MRSALLISILAIGLGGAAPAVANDDVASVSVAMDDLDLSNPADEARLRTRLNRAAKVVCRNHGTRGLNAYVSFETCKSAALGNANLEADRAIATARLVGGGEVKTARR